MIVFRGELSEENKKRLNRGMRTVNIITAAILSAILAVFITLAVVYDDTVWAIAYAIIPVMLLASALPVPSKKQNLVCPEEIIFDDTTVSITGDVFGQKREISQIKKIVDLGTCYKIVFYFPNNSFHCLCQKDLIVEGTIEQFEQRFSGLITRP